MNSIKIRCARIYWAFKLRLRIYDHKNYLTGITPVMWIKNEDIWIETIVRTLSKVFPEIIVIDNDSQDRTSSILHFLVREGLPIKVYRYFDPSKNDNIIRNLIIDRSVNTKWFFTVDGDELQFEQSCKSIQRESLLPISDKKYSMSAYYHHVHPNSIFMITPYKFDGRTSQKRCFNTEIVRYPASGWRDAPYAGKNHQQIDPKLMDDGSVIPNSFILHMVFTQRSSIKSWKGWQSISVEHSKWRNNQYIAKEGEYTELSFFPKEILECKYDHNPYREIILKNKNIQFR